MMHLMAVQMLSIWGTVGVLWHLGRQREDIARMRREPSELDPGTIDWLAQIGRTQPVRTIRGRAHKRILHRTLAEAWHSVVILSAWVNEYVIDAAFNRRLLAALARGADIYTGYG